MARATPCTDGFTLIYSHNEGQQRIPVDSPEWLQWLSGAHTTFRFESEQGSFTARRENKGGGQYWYAYRKAHGRLHKTYLGKSTELSRERMHAALQTLLAQEAAASIPSEEGMGKTPGIIDPKTPARGVSTSAGNAVETHPAGVFPISSRTASLTRTRQENPLPESITQSTPLLTTKLYLPPTRQDLVARPRLIERLQDALQRKLTIISAPAGFGKTTLVSEWHASAPQVPLAWVSLDENDNDPSRFWNYIIAALQTLSPALGPQVLGRAQQANPTLVPLYINDQLSLEAFLTRLINAVTGLSQPLVLALDDYHLITMPVIHDGLSFLLHHLPPNLSLILLSRAEPPIPLVYLRAQNQLTEFHAADLRFTAEEIAAFFNRVMGLNLDSSEIAALDLHTEGWIAGLQLAALSMQGLSENEKRAFISRFTGSQRHILAYLTTEVLSRQPDHIQDFLLQTSILERLSPALCNAITRLPYPDNILEQLEQANLFLIPLNEQRRWYRYHHLFAEFLRERLARIYPDLVPELHRKAAAWYEQHGFLSEALAHLLAAGDYSSAARLVEQQAESLIKSGEMMALLAWFSMLPEEELRRHPRLLPHYAGMLAALGQLDAAQQRLDEAKHILEYIPITPENEASIRNIRGEMESAQTYIFSAQGNIPATIEHAEQSLALLSPDNVFVRSLISASLAQAYLLNGDLEASRRVFQECRALSEASQNAHALLVSICCEAFVQGAQGNLHRAFETYRHALEIDVGVPYIVPPEYRESMPLAKGEQRLHLPAASMAYIGMGTIAYEWNRLNEAIEYLRMALELGRQWGYMLMLAEAYDFLAMSYLARGDPQSAFHALDSAEQFISPHHIPLPLAWTQAGRAFVWIETGNLEEAAAWARTARIREYDTPNYINEYELLTLTRLHIRQGHYNIALDILDRILNVARKEGRSRSIIEILALGAACLHLQGHTNAALLSLAEALELAEPEGYLRAFLNVGTPMLELLRLASARSIHPDYTHHLLSKFENLVLAPTHPSLLSEREMDVLRRIAAGKSNQEIARELVVATSTIKTHVNSIYLKLSVHSRTQAIAQAKALGLL